MSARDDRLSALRAGLAILPEPARRVYLLHARDGVALDEVAARLGLERAQVVAHLAEALAALSRALDEPPS